MPWQPSQQNQGDTSSVTLSPFGGFSFKETGDEPSQEERQASAPPRNHSVWGGKDMLNGNKASVTPPALRPCVTLLARKVSQGWGPHGCISVQWRELGQRWPEPLSGSTAPGQSSFRLLPFRLSTPAKRLTLARTCCLCAFAHTGLSPWKVFQGNC